MNFALKIIRAVRPFTCQRIRSYTAPVKVTNPSIFYARLKGSISKNGKNFQVLDKLAVEKERGITVKAQSAALICPFEGQTYLLNLIDTPGHTDFSYEVKRSLFACDNAVLLVDACEGVMAQTLATFHLASARGLKVIPVLNKTDLPNANPGRVKDQLKSVLGINPRDVLTVSAKLGTNIEDVISTLIMEGKSPDVSSSSDLDTNCTVIDSEHHAFRGTVLTVLIRSGVLSVGMDLRLLRNNRSYSVKEIGIYAPFETPCDTLHAGQVGYAAMGIKSPAEVVTGDILFTGNEAPSCLDCIEPVKHMVFAGAYPVSQGLDHQNLRIALEKLCLNDPSVLCTTENHPALGAGWRLGFLGLLHMDVFRQRLEDEHDANLILTAPSVSYRLKIIGKKNILQYGGEWIVVHNASVPDAIVEAYEEMHVRGTVIVPQAHANGVLQLCLSRRGVLLSQDCLDETRMHLAFDFPLSEVILDFNDRLKTVSSGFASFEFVETGWQPAQLTRLSVHLNGRPVEELTQLVPKAACLARARRLADALAKEIPRQQFLIRVQVLAGNRSVAKADIKPYRKDVTAKLHAADPSRWNKLLQRQADGKRRLRMIGQISVPRDVFIKVLKTSV